MDYATIEVRGTCVLVLAVSQPTQEAEYESGFWMYVPLRLPGSGTRLTLAAWREVDGYISCSQPA